MEAGNNFGHTKTTPGTRDATQRSRRGHRRLQINFANFSDDHDEFVSANSLKSLKDIDALRSRVRRDSIQLQDHECSQVNKDLLVYAARSIQDDRRFYDGVIDKVVRLKHRYVGGEEVCACGFVVEWTSGPDIGIQTILKLADICRVRKVKVGTADDDISPVLRSFLHEVKERIESCVSNSTTTVVEKGGSDSGTSGLSKKGACDSGNVGFSKRFKASSAVRFKKDTPAKRCLAGMIGILSESSGHESHNDMDTGGVPHGLIVENLEKGISPVTIMQFLYQQVSVSCNAFVMPSKLSEPFTRGIIILENISNLEKLSNFLESPGRIIVSSRERPWVVPQKTLSDETLREMRIEVFRHTSQTALKSRTPTSNELKVVISGSQEYQKAKMLKDLFEELAGYQCGVHKRLLIKEAAIAKLPFQ